MSAAIGREVAKHRAELAAIIRKIMVAHTARKGCEWKLGAVEAILCDLAKAAESQEICKAKKAA